MNTVKISVKLPGSWQELTDEQIYYVYSLMADMLSSSQIKAYCFFRWSGVKVVCAYGKGYEVAQGKAKGYIDAGLIAAAIHTLDWIDEIPSTPIRIAQMKGHRAIDATLQDPNFEGWPADQQHKHRFDFEKYLYCENLYQGYLETQRHDLLEQMAHLLYDFPSLKLNKAEKLNIFFWWASLKALFSRTFSNFLMPVSTDELLTGGVDMGRRIQEATNAQIRALTGGDVTKRKEVLALDVWTAMWELDAKAKEYKEIESKYGKK